MPLGICSSWQKLGSRLSSALWSQIILPVIKSIIVLIVTFYVVNIFYKFLNAYSYRKFSDDQIYSIVSAQTKSKDFEFEFVKFKSNEKPAIAVLVNSDVDTNDIAHKSKQPARLSIFEVSAKNPIEKILFDTDLYQLKHSYDLVPQGSKENYELISSSLKTIDLFNDSKEEVFFCLMFAFGGSGTSFDCSIFDGDIFYPAFPQTSFSSSEQKRDYYLTLDQVDSQYNFSSGEKEPIFSSIGSDTVFYFDDKTDTMTFLDMKWLENESHASPHLYDVYHYKLSSFKDFLFSGSNDIIFTGGFVRTTKENERGKPYDVLIKEYLSK